MLRTERFGLVLSPKEKAVVTLLAEAEGGLSQADVIRRLIRQEASKKGVWSAVKADHTGESDDDD